MTDRCCDAWEAAQQAATDSSGYGSLIEYYNGGWQIGLGLPAIKYCPWCGTKKTYASTLEKS